MARRESQRKALRTVFRLFCLALVSAIVSFPLAFTGTILMNPLLGRLEAKYGVELTGHSGPADWIFALVFAVVSLAMFAALVLLTRWTSTAASEQRRENPPGDAT